jgi:hypothetical protein
MRRSGSQGDLGTRDRDREVGRDRDRDRDRGADWDRGRGTSGSEKDATYSRRGIEEEGEGRSRRERDEMGRSRRGDDDDDEGRSRRGSDELGRSRRGDDDEGRSRKGSDELGRSRRGSDEEGRSKSASRRGVYDDEEDRYLRSLQRSGDRDRDRGGGRDGDRERDRGSERDYVRSRDMDEDRGRFRGEGSLSQSQKERERERDRERGYSRERSRDGNPDRSSRRDGDRDRDRDDRDDRGNHRSSGRPALREGMSVEAQYKGKGKWYKGVVKYVHDDGYIDVEYDDGERDLDLPPKCVTAIRPKREEESSAGKVLEGDRVEGNYRGKGKWFPGKITRDRGDHTFDIAYDDGESETRVDELLIRLIGGGGGGRDRDSGRIEEGSKVEGNYRGKGKWYAGTVTRDRGDHTFDISYDDGESETRVDVDCVRLFSKARDDHEYSDNRETKTVHFRVGDAVLYRLSGGKGWIPGSVTRVNSDCLYDIRLDEGDLKRDVEARKLKRLERLSSPTNKLFKGDSVEVKSTMSSATGRKEVWKAGKIMLVNSDGSMDIDYSDGDKKYNVPASLVRVMKEIILGEGDKVEARYRGRSKFYPGKITRDRGDNTFDIAYDDGESETKVIIEYIKLIKPIHERQKKDSTGNNKSSGRIEEGSKVEGNYRGKGKWYAGTVTRDRGDRTFDISYDDGESETRVEEALIRLIGGGGVGSFSPLKAIVDIVEGSLVEGNYKGRNWYPGKVSLVRLNGTFDILYDDGEVERSVSRENVRLKAAIGGYHDDLQTPPRSSASVGRSDNRAQKSYAISDID